MVFSVCPKSAPKLVRWGRHSASIDLCYPPNVYIYFRWIAGGWNAASVYQVYAAEVFVPALSALFDILVVV